MIDIPAGSFMMGHVYQYDPAQSEKVNRYYPDEQPVLKRTVQAFQLAETTVTQAQYEKLMGEESNRSTSRGGDLPVDTSDLSSPAPAPAGDDDIPF